MNKLIKPLIILTSFCFGQTTAFAHGAHGTETSIVHQFTQPQHLVELFVIGTLIGLFFVLRKLRRISRKSS